LSPAGKSLRRILPAATATLAVLVAARLFVPAAALAFSSRGAAEFRATGLPAWIRFALALPEMAGAVFLSIPRTVVVGAGVLVLDLAGAIGVHLYLGIQPVSLYLLVLAVITLGLARIFIPAWVRRP
jgi:hypothetical protein